MHNVVGRNASENAVAHRDKHLAGVDHRAELDALVGTAVDLRPDPDTGYMVTPASPAVRDCLTREARKRSVLIDGASVA